MPGGRLQETHKKRICRISGLKSCRGHLRNSRVVAYERVQSTPDNSNLQGKSKKARVIGSSSYREFEENSREYGKKQFLLHSEHFNHI